MNHTITKNGNDFKVESMEKHDIDYEPVKLEFPMLKGRKDERLNNYLNSL